MESNKDFLVEYYRDSQETMRWLTTNEQRLAEFLILLYTLIVGLLNRKLNQALNDLAGYFFIAISAAVILKIYCSHRKYVAIGKCIQKVWEYFKMFDKEVYGKEAILPESLKDPKKGGYGSGPGYMFTISIIIVVTVAAVTIAWKM